MSLDEACIWLVPTPIGNLGDMTLRGLQILREADAIACEDTRRTGVLLAHFEIKKPLVRLDAHTMYRAEAILQKYPRLAYVSDAGTPGISDPGAELVKLAHQLEIAVEVLPGATAFVPALVLSGLASGRFCFEGFLPRAGRERKERLQVLSARPETTLLYESPHRLYETLQTLINACGSDRQASITRELSKKFEETRHGTLAELAQSFAEGVKGEIVIAIAGATQAPVAADDNHTQAQHWAKEGLSVRDIRERLIALGLRKNEAYELALSVMGSKGEE